MALVAECDTNGLVINVIVIPDDVTDRELTSFCRAHGKQDSIWVRTYQSKERTREANPRVHYAGKGFIYRTDLDAFVPPKPERMLVDGSMKKFDSWELNTETIEWEPPKPMPEEDNKMYEWDEDKLDWVEIPVHPDVIAEKLSGINRTENRNP